MILPNSFFSYQKGILTSEGCSLSQLADDVGTPAYFYSAEGFLSSFKRLDQGLQGVDHLICYAVKSNSNIAILHLLGKQGAGMDIVSGGELHRARAAGISDDRIVFSGIGKQVEEMQSALGSSQSSGIYSFNIESIPELYLLNDLAKSLNKKAPIALRFNPDVNPKTHPYISTGLKENKFGLHKAEIMRVIQELKNLPALHLKGISVHIGSQLLSLSPLRDSFQKLSSLILEISPLLPSPLEFVDLGGGIGIPYQNERAPLIEKYCQLVQTTFGKNSKFSKQLVRPLRILIEPGRVIAANSGILITQILFRKERPKKDFLIVDAAMNDLMRPALYGSYHEILPLHALKSRKTDLKKTDLVGPICESSDCFGKNRLLPKSLQRGDRLAILSAGAYGFTMSSNYNSRPRPPEVLLQNGNYHIIRKRESIESLSLGESFIGKR